MTVPHFAISSLSLTGSLEQKLAAIADAGFDAIELGALDLSGSSSGVGGAIECIRNSGLRISALQEIKDFGGHSGRILAYKLELAKSYLRQMERLGCRQLIVTPATSAHASPDLDRTAEDLRILATLATPLGIRIGFKPLSWAPSVYTVRQAWEAIERAGNPNLNLVVDSFHLVARAESPEDLMDIPVSRIGLVQLSDVAMSAFPALEDQIDIARHYRLYPGEGSHGGEIRDLVRFFRDTGYAGDYVFDVYNDKYLALSPAEALQHAVRSRQWLLDGLD
ncbi:MAG: sugar phosphate isomerase/epimerase [Oceanospirillaceae bacterium]|nr:sugar phosphate isomerase/epimerase [Oceanospirillaceae bacterium]